MSRFAALAERLDELSGLPSRITRPVADGINDQIARQFTSGCDPYGDPWEPLLPQTVRRKGGDTRILVRTGALASLTVAKPMAGAGIEIESEDYGQFHQGGTVHMDARPILPDGAELPDEWQDIIENALSRETGRKWSRQ